MSQTHARFGTTSIVPTVISTDQRSLQKSIQAVSAAIAEKVPGILGIHWEGPYLNPLKKGIHGATHIRPFAWSELDAFLSSQISVKMLTLAPELVPCEALQQLAVCGILLFAGHTTATYGQMEKAVACGLQGVTHLFNACSPLESREPGVVGYALLDDQLWCSVLADGLHVDLRTLALLFKNKPLGRILLVSDTMAPFGSPHHPPGSFFKIGEQEILFDGKKYNNPQGVLGGSHLCLLWAVQNLVRRKIVPLETALACASLNPSRCLKLDHRKGRLLPNYDADILVLDKDDLRLIRVYQMGQVISK